MEIEHVVEEELAKIINSGKVRSMVAAGIERSIQGAINEALQPYSDFGKALGSKVKEAIGIELHSVNLQTAVLGLGQLVEAQVSKYITEQSHPILLKRLDDLFKPAPKSITLQELIDAYKEDESDDAAADSIEYCGLVIGEPDQNGYIQIGLNPDARKKLSGYSSTKEQIRKVQDCEIKMHLKPCGTIGYTLYWCQFGGYEQKSTKDFLPMALYGFSRQLFQMYAAGTVLTFNEGMDADNYNCAYPGND